MNPFSAAIAEQHRSSLLAGAERQRQGRSARQGRRNGRANRIVLVEAPDPAATPRRSRWSDVFRPAGAPVLHTGEAPSPCR